MNTKKWHLAGWLTAAMLTTGSLGYAIDFTAGVNLTAQGTVAFDATLKNFQNDQNAATFGWTGVTLLQTAWDTADQYVLLNSTITAGDQVVRIYTDNKAETASPKYTGTPTSTAAGLVDNSDTTKTLPMSWHVMASKPAQSPAPQDPDDDTNGWNWFYFTDKSAPLPDAALKDYSTLAKDTGVHVGRPPANDPWDGYAKSLNTETNEDWRNPNYVFVAANFTDALARVYSTNKIVVEQAVQ